MTGPALLIILGLMVVAIRHPLIRRLGIRNAVRRPREALLVMLGCVLGTALIVGTSAVGDSFTESIRVTALNRLGEIDATIRYPDRDQWSAATERFSTRPPDTVSIAAAAVTLEVPLTSDSSNQSAPRARILEVDYRRAGVLTRTSGVRAGEGPTPGTAWASTALARTLNLTPDSIVTIHTGIPDQEILITKVVDGGLVTFLDGQFDSGDNLLVAPGTVEILRQQQPKALLPRYRTLIAGTGPKIETAAEADLAKPLEEQLTTFVSPFEGEVTMARADSVKSAEFAGKNQGALLVSVGGFGVIAGILLLVNVLLMLAEERLGELGTMRAVGLARRPLIGSFMLEGCMYAAVGAVMGGLAGTALGRLMVGFATRSTDLTQRGSAQIELDFAMRPGTLVGGVALGFVISSAAVFGTAYRVSRMEMIRLIRDLPPAPRTRRPATTPLLTLGVVIGPLLSWFGYAAPASLPFVLGLPIAFVCLGGFASRRFGRTIGVTIACAPTIVWGTLFEVLDQDRDTAPYVVVVGGVFVVLAGVVLMNALQPVFANLVRRAGTGRGTVTTRVGLANPIAHRVRMLLTVGPFALVVFTLVYAEGLSNVATTEISRLKPVTAGSYEVLVRSSAANPFDFSKLREAGATAVAETASVTAQFRRVDAGGDATLEPRLWPVTVFDQSMTSVTPPRLVRRDPGYSSDVEAFNAVARDPNLVILPKSFLVGGLANADEDEFSVRRRPNSGQIFEMVDPVSGRSRDVRVVGVLYAEVIPSAAFIGKAGATEMFGDRVIPSAAFATVAGDPNIFRTQLQQAGIENGLEVIVFADEVERFFKLLRSLVNLYRADLGVGLVVGIAGVGVVLVRSVRDRRRQIGTLRAMGFEARSIGQSFLIEGAFVASQALFVGAILGQAIAMSTSQSQGIVEGFGDGVGLPGPTLSVGLLCLSLLLASLAASAGPARAATKIPPAAALRLVD